MRVAKPEKENLINSVTKKDQLYSKRTKPKSKNFSPKVKLQIFERDDYKCVRCGTMTDLESVPHHIYYKSQGGRGTLDNGVTSCRACHRWAHSCKEGRKWFEDYAEQNLL